MIVKLLTRGLKQIRISWTVRTKAKKEYVRILLVLLNFRLRKKGEVVSKLIYIDTHSNACCTFFLTGPVEDGPSAKDHIFFTFLFFFFFFSFSRGPLLDWFTQIMLYSHWSTQTECSTHSRSKQPLMKLCVAHCTHLPLVSHVV